MNCRYCKSDNLEAVIDLGFQPPSNQYLEEQDQNRYQMFYPLRVNVCAKCFLVQTEDYVSAEHLFSKDYAYFSSTSKTWLSHSREYSKKMKQMLSLDGDSFVVEVASNDGYLLKNFKEWNIPCLGVEPTAAVAKASRKLGIKTVQEFFGSSLALKLVEEEGLCDLILGNNVYAHVPDVSDFTKGLSIMLKPEGVVTLEFPHLLNLVKNLQFDTIYHEHFSYFSLTTVADIFEKNGLKVFDVELLNTHGGSLRVFGAKYNSKREITKRVGEVLQQEQAYGLFNISTYEQFRHDSIKAKNNLLLFLLELKQAGKRVVGYGAAAKGNTFMNYAGVKPDLLDYVVDAAPSKQDKWLPGTNIRVYNPSKIRQDTVDYVWVLPWNIVDEVTNEFDDLRQKGTIFFTANPNIKIIK